MRPAHTMGRTCTREFSRTIEQFGEEPNKHGTSFAQSRWVEPITAVDSPAFGDTSGAGTAAAVYAVVQQPSGTNEGLLAAESRLAKKGLTVPRLELVSAHIPSRRWGTPGR